MTESRWTLAPHVCRVCLGRLLVTEHQGRRRWRCSNCGTEAHGATATVLCCCGIKLGKAQRDAGIRCVANPDPRPECMSEIVAVQAVIDGKAARPAPTVVGDSTDDEGFE